MSTYVNLHCHDCYSIRDSCLKIEDLIKISLEYKLPAVSVTNHGNGHSWYKLYKEAKKNGIKPIIAQEFYYANEANNKGDNYHLCIYAKNQVGYKNLCKLSSIAYMGDNFYRKPRIDFNILKNYSEGLIISTACCFSKPAQLIINNQIDDAIDEINRFVKLFGDDFYLEVHDHGIDDEVIVRNWYRNYGREKGIKVIACNDTHYARKEDQTFHGIFKNIAYASGGEKDSSFNGTDFHILSPEEMSKKFLQNELDNTIEISEKCNIEFKHNEYHLPKFNIPNKEQDTHEYLRDLCYKGLKEKGLDSKKEYIDRLEYELNMLHLADLENYTLVVADYMEWCYNNDIYTSPGRGSMAGSLVSYLTNITKIDPLVYDLLLQRAVNVGRVLQYQFFE